MPRPPKAPQGQLDRIRRRKKGGKVTVRYPNGETEVVRAHDFIAVNRKPQRRAKWKPTMARQLARHGYPSYRAYLASSHWRDVRRRYYASGLPKGCFVCGERGCDLHHKTYERLGAEHLWDLVPLCRDHHSEVHEYVKQHGDNGAVLWKAAKDLKKAQGRRKT